MARVSTKENKNIYQTTREGLKLTREAASELLETIAPEPLTPNDIRYTGMQCGQTRVNLLRTERIPPLIC